MEKISRDKKIVGLKKVQKKRFKTTGLRTFGVKEAYWMVSHHLVFAFWYLAPREQASGLPEILCRLSSIQHGPVVLPRQTPLSLR